MRRYRCVIDELRVELEMAVARCRLRGAARERRRRQLARRVEALKDQIASHRDQLAGERERSAIAWRRLETDLTIAVERISNSFDRLLSHA